MNLTTLWRSRFILKAVRMILPRIATRGWLKALVGGYWVGSASSIEAISSGSYPMYRRKSVASIQLFQTRTSSQIRQHFYSLAYSPYFEYTILKRTIFFAIRDSLTDQSLGVIFDSYSSMLLLRDWFAVLRGMYPCATSCSSSISLRPLSPRITPMRRAASDFIITS